ncbi:unnamed protein product, partial [Allacma fusca]
MTLKMVFVNVSTFLAILVVSTYALPKSGIQGKRTEALHPDYRVEWQADYGEQTIEFWISANTTGFVFFGITNTGDRDFDGADLVIGGVEHGSAYFQDNHGLENASIADEIQNWDVKNIKESAGKTVLNLKRKFETEGTYDANITFGTTNLLWGIGQDDDIETDQALLRGSYLVNLLDPPLPEMNLLEFEIFQLNLSIDLDPKKETLHWCQIVKRSSTKKTHITAIKPTLDSPEALKHVRNINIYRCKPSKDSVPDPNALFGPIAGKPGQDCSTSVMQDMNGNCDEDVFAWSLGGRMLAFPKNVGFPLGEDENEYFMAQFSLDNQDKLDTTFETGVVFYHTEKLRKHEAGILTMRYGTIIIPPDTKNWTVSGYCNVDCTNDLPKHGIHLFNVNLHAHASGSGMSLRHFRGDAELARIVQDDTYDFRYQENRPLHHARKVLPGDELKLECTYDTTWKHPAGVVIGGPGSHDEMCMAFIYYYPRTRLVQCQSDSNINLILRQQFDIITSDPGEQYLNPVIEEPSEWETWILSDVLNTEIDWTDAFRSTLEQEFQKKENLETSCFRNDLPIHDHHGRRHKKDRKHVHGLIEAMTLKMASVKFSIFLAILAVSTDALPKTGIQGKRTESLHPDYRVEWQADYGEKTIEFWISANTTGFVGFGISNTGDMDGADLVFGGVQDGSAYFQDYHGVKKTPVADETQNWDIKNITESDGKTVLHLKRKFETEDIYDVNITFGTTKLLWTIGKDDDPKTLEGLMGSYPVNLLDPPLPEMNLSEFETFHLNHSIVLDPNLETLYWCQVHIRSATNKTHMTAIKPTLDSPEALKHVHHINIYGCKSSKDSVPDPDALFGQLAGKPGQDCLNEGIIQDIQANCNEDVYAWSLGGRMLVFPENVGFPLGEDEHEYFVVQYHLDNNDKLDTTIETGLTIYHTEKLRQHEAGILSVGYEAPSIIIPPDTKSWTVSGYCIDECTKTLPKHGIHLFNVNLHAHASGSGMSLRHFRGDAELARIVQDDTYDFRYQENRPLHHPRKVLPGDELKLECTYDTTWKDPAGVVIGGRGSHDEMCMTFIYYYPRSSLRNCYSVADIDVILRQVFSIEAPSYAPESFDLVIESPPIWKNRTLSDFLNTQINWTDATRSILQQQFQKNRNLE